MTICTVKMSEEELEAVCHILEDWLEAFGTVKEDDFDGPEEVAQQKKVVADGWKGLEALSEAVKKVVDE